MLAQRRVRRHSRHHQTRNAVKYILRENLISGLRQSIRYLEEQGRGECGQAEIFREVIAALERGETVEIR